MNNVEKDDGLMKMGVDGRLHLNFSVDGNQTKLHVKAQHPPLRVIRAFEHEAGVALVHFHNVSGGILGGDQFDVQIDIDEAAHALVTTTGANRIYRHRDGYVPAKQVVRVRVMAGGTLEYIPDATIPFADSHFVQETEIVLGDGANLIWSEIIAPGRTAFDELFAWREFDSLFRIGVNRKGAEGTEGEIPIMIEKWRVRPSVDDVTSLAWMGEWTHMATLFVCQGGMDGGMLHRLEAELTEIAQALSGDDVVWGVSRLVRDGVVVRGLGRVGRLLPTHIEQFHNCGRTILIGKSLILPRKIY